MNEKITEVVRSKYGSIAESGLSSDQAGVRAVAQAFGYTEEELRSIPAAANMGLSCGNPVATAALRPGEVVVDLGCGGGLDVFLAAERVGPTGKAIGIDMTPAMIALAEKNARSRPASARGRVEFHLARIDSLPLPAASVDCVISNCVINLAPDKSAVFREIARILKPGGRLAVSDIALKKALPPALGNDLMAYVGCIAGAIPIEDYRRGLAEAGFAAVEVIDSGADLNAYAKNDGGACCVPPAPPTSVSVPLATSSAPRAAASSCCGPTAAKGSCCGGPGPAAEQSFHGDLASLLARYDVNDYAASVKVFAVKPR